MLLTPTRMALRLAGGYPAQYNQSRFGASLDLLGFYTSGKRIALHAGAPGYDSGMGALLRLEVDLDRGLGIFGNASVSAAYAVSPRIHEASGGNI